MQSQNNPFLDNLFNGLSSVYNKDSGMVNSNMYTILNSYALMFQDIQRVIDQAKANTYIATAAPQVLQDNFGVLIDFPKPPRLNSLSNGDEIYRAILRALYQDYQLAPTSLSIQKAVSIILSFLVTDPNTTGYYQETDEVILNIPDTTIQLAYNAVKVVNGAIVGVADVSDITFFPSDFTVTGYDDNTKTITFSGNPTISQNYSIVYYRNNSGLEGTNWINLTSPSATNVLPLDLKTTTKTFDNYQFSYWWNTYNRDDVGVEIIENLLENEDQGIVWRLPQRTVSYINPYNASGNIFQSSSIDAYNSEGGIYDINIVTPSNPDSLISTIPLDYFSDVSVNTDNFYIRYSADNALFVPFDVFIGSFGKFNKTNYSLAFNSVNYGNLDFFEIGEDFDNNDLFGYGTKHIWMDVPYLNGQYVLNNSVFFDRQISLHERTIFQDNFEEGNLDKWNTLPAGYSVVGEALLNPSSQKEDCIKLFATVSGSATKSSPMLPNNIGLSGNRVGIDFLDIFNSGTKTFVDVTRVSGNAYSQIRFGIEPNILDYYSSLSNSSPIGFIETYFPSSGNISNNIQFQYVVSGVAAPYNLTSGNLNIGVSDFSLTPSTELLTQMFSNMSSSDVSNCNRTLFNFGWSGNSVDLKFNFIQHFGQIDVSGPAPNPPNIVDTFAPYNMTLSFVPGNPEIIYTVDKFYYDDINKYVYQLPSAMGTTGILVSSGSNTVEIMRGEFLKVNGETYTGPFDPSVAWNQFQVGTGPMTSNQISQFNVGDPKSFSIQSSAPTSSGNSSYCHYYVGNSNISDAVNQHSGINTRLPYYYQLTNSPNNIDSVPKTYLSGFPRSRQWHRLTYYFGVSSNGVAQFSGLNVSLDDYQFLNNSNIGFVAQLSGVSTNHSTIFPQSEFSYFDNVKASYYDTTQTLPEYRVGQVLSSNWGGSILDQSTVLEDRVFSQESVSNFHFLVSVLGWSDDLVFIVQKVVDKLKPAYAFASILFKENQHLDTGLGTVLSDADTNWESGNIDSNIIIKVSGSFNNSDITESLPGFITVNPSGNAIF